MKITLTLGQLKRLVRESRTFFEDDENQGEERQLMRASTEWMRRKYNEFNERIFNNWLGECNFDIFTTGSGSQGTCLGKFCMGIKGTPIYVDGYSRRMYKYDSSDDYFNKTWITKDNFYEEANPTIKLNGNYQATEKALEATLVHEMCHYFTYMRGYSPKQAHGPEFRRIAAHIEVTSHDEFSVRRVATAEEVANYVLDPEMQAKRDRRLENKKNRAKALLVYSGTYDNVEVKLSMVNNTELMKKIIYDSMKKYGGFHKAILCWNKEVVDFLFNKGYRKVFRTWRFWQIGAKPWLYELEDLLGHSDPNQIKVFGNEKDYNDFFYGSEELFNEESDAENSDFMITPDMNLGTETAFD